MFSIEYSYTPDQSYIVVSHEILNMHNKLDRKGRKCFEVAHIDLFNIFCKILQTTN